MNDKKIYHEVITLAWSMLRDNLEDPDWKLIYQKTNELSKKYRGTDYEHFAAEIFATVLDELNRRSQN